MIYSIDFVEDSQMYDYWGKLLHMSEKFCNFASAMKGAPMREESGKTYKQTK